MAKKDNQQALIIILAIAVGFLIIGGQKGWFKGGTTYITTSNTTITNLLNAGEEGSCTLSINPNTITSGDTIVGMITATPNTLCEIYGINTASITPAWIKVAEGTTGANGKISVTDTFGIVGKFNFRAICGKCVTNIESLTVNPITTVKCIDSDGNDIFTFGWVDDTEALVSYSDSCYNSNSVVEYVCNPLPSAMMPQDCPTTHKCEGGRCIEKTGYNVGDVVGGSSGTGTIPAGVNEGHWTFDLSSVETGGSCRLGAKISTWWAYKELAGCNHIAYGYEGVEWNFYDSTNWVWGALDDVPPMPPRTNYVDLCPLSWDGQNNWELEMYKMYNMPGCDIDYNYEVEIYVCEC